MSCISGQIYDSSPVDFTGDLGARFALHPAILRVPGSAKLASLVAKGVTSSLDALFLTRFGSERSDYWQTLYSSVVSLWLAHTHSVPSDSFSCLSVETHLCIICSAAESGIPISHFMFRKWWHCSISNNLQLRSALARVGGNCSARYIEQLFACRLVIS